MSLFELGIILLAVFMISKANAATETTDHIPVDSAFSFGQFKCPAIGFFPVKADCRNYHVCAMPNTYTFGYSACPVGKSFDPVRRKCAATEHVDCNGCKINGYQKDPKSQFYYIFCKNGAGTRMRCYPHGHIFSEEKLMCLQNDGSVPIEKANNGTEQKNKKGRHSKKKTQMMDFPSIMGSLGSDFNLALLGNDGLFNMSRLGAFGGETNSTGTSAATFDTHNKNFMIGQMTVTSGYEGMLTNTTIFRLSSDEPQNGTEADKNEDSSTLASGSTTTRSQGQRTTLRGRTTAYTSTSPKPTKTPKPQSTKTTTSTSTPTASEVKEKKMKSGSTARKPTTTTTSNAEALETRTVMVKKQTSTKSATKAPESTAKVKTSTEEAFTSTEPDTTAEEPDITTVIKGKSSSSKITTTKPGESATSKSATTTEEPPQLITHSSKQSGRSISKHKSKSSKTKFRSKAKVSPKTTTPDPSITTIAGVDEDSASSITTVESEVEDSASSITTSDDEDSTTIETTTMDDDGESSTRKGSSMKSTTTKKRKPETKAKGSSSKTAKSTTPSSEE